MSFASITKRLRNLSWLRRERSRHLVLGVRGERAAARHLKRHHHRILARNYRCSAGEVDLITGEGGTIVFVEVKTRTSERTQDIAEAVSQEKWRRVERAARRFLMSRVCGECAYRFDLVTVLWPPQGPAVIEHFENAYQPRYF